MRFIPTQTERLMHNIRAAGRRGLSYLELELLRISSCPWRRLAPDERPERYLRKGEKLERFVKDEMTYFRIVRVR